MAPQMSMKVNTADLARFRREFTALSMDFPKESGRAARKLGNAIMRSMRTALQKGRSGNAKTIRFSGNWAKLNPLYVYMRGLVNNKTFAGKLAGKTGSRKGENATGGLGSPIGYFYDEEGLSLAVGMFRSVPGMRNARKRQSEAVVSESAARSFEKFQSGSSRPALDARARHAVYQQIAAFGGGPAEIAMARHEMAKGWVTPSRQFIDPIGAANLSNWANYLISQCRYIIRQKARRAVS